MIKKSDISTEFVKEKVNEFNKRVERLTGEGLEFLQPVDADNIFKLSEAQIARWPIKNTKSLFLIRQNHP